MSVMRLRGERQGPVPGCPKIHTWTARLDARAELLRLWRKGDYTCNGTHWCNAHEGYHLTAHARKSGKNYSYRD